MDLNSLDGIRGAATEFLEKSMILNILIINAGIMAPPQGKNVDGFELQVGTYPLAHFLLTHLLKATPLVSSTPGFNSHHCALLFRSPRRRRPI